MNKGFEGMINIPSESPREADGGKQREVERFWDAAPCDSGTSAMEAGTKDYFWDIEEHRYRLQPHIRELLCALDLDGKQVLEVGTGVGTDARLIIGLGADYCGINVDAGSSKMTRRALEVFGLDGEVLQASALDIPYPDESFDVVYSFGVLHHIPDVRDAVSEISRVLKPGGRLIVMLYNRTSINYAIEIRHLRKWGIRLLGIPGVVRLLGVLGLPAPKLHRHLELWGGPGNMTDEEWLSRNTDGPDNPYSSVYNRAQTEALLADFVDTKQSIYFFDHRHWGPIGRLLSPAARAALGTRWGWHRVATAHKPTR